MKKKILSSIILILVLLSSTLVYATDEQAEIPTAYDLRDELSIKVENQGTRPWCDEYSKTKMVETFLQKTRGINYNLSEAYMAYFKEFDGTYEKQVLESDFPTKDYIINEENKKKYDEATSKAVAEFNFLSIDVEHEMLKNYIMNYGGTTTLVLTDNQWHKYKGGIYHKEKYSGGFHGVLIIGWDDNYSKDNFYYEKPENDGAWLVLNSWGSSWGNNGTAWISYEDSLDLMRDTQVMNYVELANGEIIETKLTDEKQKEIKKTETPVTEQETQKMLEEYNNMQNIFIIVFAVAVILLILLIIIKHRNLSKSKDNKGNKKSKLKIVLTIALILILLTFIFML